jgi:restriction endonuclease BglII
LERDAVLTEDELDYLVYDFRNALVILRSKASFTELEAALHSIDANDVLAAHQRLADERAQRGSRAPAGGQSALNEVINDKLTMVGWESQPALFRDKALEKWKMDFRKEGIGVEVSFNHAEAIPWQFTRLNIAGESERVIDDNRIEVGVVVCAAPSLKAWARMDGAVGTFDQFKAWLREMRPILPVPLLLLGLETSGWPEGSFRGTDTGSRTRVGGVSDVIVGAGDPFDDEADVTQ